MKCRFKPNNWFHKNLSDREAASRMLTPVNEDEDEIFAIVVLRGSECTKVNFIFDKTSTNSIVLMRGLSEEGSWVSLKVNPEILLRKDCQCNL